MNGARSLAYTVEAYNLSHASENKIHDNNIASRLGFKGGLVPGVEVFAYATHLALEYFGPEFLKRGAMECRFEQPVYDGQTANVFAVEDRGGLDMTVESQDVVCATGSASMHAVPIAEPLAANYEIVPPSATRPPADEGSLAVDQILCTKPETLTRDQLASYLVDVRETNPIYTDESIAHPGILLRLCNSALKDNVMLAPWIHTGSLMQNFAMARVGDVLSARAKVVANYDRRGHRLVDLDCLIVANGHKPIAHVLHTAIYRLRHLAA